MEKDYSDAIVCSWDIKKELKDDGFIDYRNYLTNCINCFAIARKTGYFKIADPNKRIYTNFVSLSDNIRLNNISFGQDQLTTNDIPSSFPLFFSLWVVSQGIAKENPELKEFVRGLNCGEFYDHLCTKLNNNKDLNPDREYAKKPYKRNDAKQLFQVWLNGKNVNTSGAITNTDINYVMDRYYPDIMAVFLGAKTESNSIYFILENLEAQFIFNTICKRLYSEIPGIKIITCHDAIYYEKCFEHQVQPIWKEELNKLYGNLIFDPDDDGYYKKSRKKVRKDKSVIDFDDVFGLTDEEATVIEEIKVTTNNIDLFFDDGSYPKEDPFKKLINDYKLPDNFYNFPKKKRLFDHEELFDDYNEDDVDDDIDPWEDTPPDEDDDSGFLLY